MRVTADTNVLVRAAVPPQAWTGAEDRAQAEAARDALRRASLVAVALPALCEFVWVLERAYGYRRAEIAAALRRLAAAPNVVCDGPAALEAGLAVLEAGGDFADGAIAASGASLGGDAFLSFDRAAVRLLRRLGRDARVPAASGRG